MPFVEREEAVKDSFKTMKCNSYLYRHHRTIISEYPTLFTLLMIATLQNSLSLETPFRGFKQINS